MLRLLVTGSRKFTDQDLVREWIFEAVDTWRCLCQDMLGSTTMDLSSNLRWVTMIQGKARGFDTLAANVARDCGMTIVGIGADWDEFDRGAGIQRNVRLLVEGKPNYALVGPGEYGTGHMTGLLRSAGVRMLYKGDEPIT